MPFKLESNAEPIPGYRLIERLGGGGFGEVWKAIAPGGLHKAIKFVYGDLEAPNDEDGARAEQELKAMSRVKSVRHPYILSLERFDIIDGQLLIVMELADRTLWDRFKECRSQGLPGIPRVELLGYLTEVAEALDLMNDQYQLQHLDIKPQNLFLVYHHVKVADFGLVKDLEGHIASVTGGVTPVYAAPETFEGYVSCYSDQYSLAIVYQELLTGQRPFQGTTLRQLVLQHLRDQPNLTSLPPGDRPAVSRVLEKDPEKRFPNCTEFIAALQAASPGRSSEGTSAEERPPTPQPRLEVRRPAAPVAPPAQGSLSNGQFQTEGRPERSSQPLTVEVQRNRELATPGPQPAAPLAQRAVVSEAAHDAPGARTSSPTPAKPAATTAPHSTTIHPPLKRTAPQVRGDGVLLPALVIGLGALGQSTLRQLRRQISAQFGACDALPNIRLLYLDTDPETMQQASQGGEHALLPREMLLTRLHRTSHYLKPREDENPLDGWLPRGMLYRISRQQVPAGCRALGRLAFVDNYPSIQRRLQAEIAACCDGAALKEAAKQSGLHVASTSPRVYIVAALGGGTGSGAFLDVAYTVRELLKQQGYTCPDVVGVLLLPPGQPAGATHAPAGQAQAQANAVAALNELEYYASSGRPFQARYPNPDGSGKTTTFTATGSPLLRCLLLQAEEETGWKPSGPEGQGPAAATVLQAASAVYVDLCTTVGRLADRKRTEWLDTNAPWCADPAQRLYYQSTGMYRVVWPRQPLLTKVGRLVCRKLVQRWMSKDAQALRSNIQEWIRQQWEGLQLSGEELILRLQELCETTLRRAPESLFTALVEPLAPPVVAKRPAGKATEPESLKPEAVFEVLEQLEQLLGVPEGCRSPITGKEGGALSCLTGTPLDRPASIADPGLLVEVLRDGTGTLANECEQKLAELIVRLIEQPEFRLAGAEESIRQLSVLVQQALTQQEALAKELQERTQASFQRLLALLENRKEGGTASQEGAGWKFSSGKKGPADSPAQEMLELLRAYPKYRYQSLVLHFTNSFYVGLRGQLSDQLREVDYCRQRLSELGEMFNDDNAAKRAGRLQSGDVQLPSSAGLMLFPEGCKKFEDAVKLLDKRLGPADLGQLDQQVQEVIRTQFQALVHVCMASANLVRALQPLMQSAAEQFLVQKLGNPDVVRMYLERPGREPEALVDELREAFDEAGATLARNTSVNELNVFAAPDSPGKEQLQQTLQKTTSDADIQTATCPDEIILYRERWHATLAEMKLPSKPAREAYERLTHQDTSTPHSRLDITSWRTAAT